MRHIPLNDLLPQFLAGPDGENANARLGRAHQKLRRKRTAKTRKKYIDNNGSDKWKPFKEHFTTILGHKCWYTEAELVGGPLVIDHYRPVCDYWWLAFDPENYRVACAWANSSEHNAIHGRAGGKGDNFPLLPPGIRATRRDELPNENPIILDPCNEEDCALVAFQADGQPVLNPDFVGNAIAVQRFQQSELLLNLNHAKFNEKREQLRLAIEADIRIHEALATDSPERLTVRARLLDRIAPNAPFTTASRFYLRAHRELDWVETLLNA